MVWTKQEIDSYKAIDNPKLDVLYEALGIHKYDPEARAKYLAEDVLKLTMTDHEIVMSRAAEKGKGAALNLLEEMLLATISEGKGSGTGKVPVIY